MSQTQLDTQEFEHLSMSLLSSSSDEDTFNESFPDTTLKYYDLNLFAILIISCLRH